MVIFYRGKIFYSISIFYGLVICRVVLVMEIEIFEVNEGAEMFYYCGIQKFRYKTFCHKTQKILSIRQKLNSKTFLSNVYFELLKYNVLFRSFRHIQSISAKCFRLAHVLDYCNARDATPSIPLLVKMISFNKNYIA